MPHHIIPDISILNEYLLYDDDLGVLFWRKRPDGEQWSNSWNSRCAGKRAGTPSLGRIVVTLHRVAYLEHRLIWKMCTDTEPPYQLDHVDNDPIHNHFSNLRPATNAQNQWNRRPNTTTKSGLKGAVEMGNGRWASKIKVNGVQHHLGTFYTPEDAHAAYNAAALLYHGEFAR